MPFKIEPGKVYRSPISFGPALRAVQGPDGKFLDSKSFPKNVWLKLQFRTNWEQLDAVTPEALSVVRDNPIVTIIRWIGYQNPTYGYRVNEKFIVSWPVEFKGERDHHFGDFFGADWGSMPDHLLFQPENGIQKLWCELPNVLISHTMASYCATWMGFRFFDAQLSNLKQLSAEEVAHNYPPGKIGPVFSANSDGMLNFKYVPRTGEWDKADAAYVVLMPGLPNDEVVDEVWVGEGSGKWYEATWQDVPLFHHVINGLRAFEVKEWLPAVMAKSHGTVKFANTMHIVC